MKRAFLLAYPAGHSLSPAMHNAAFAQLGILARYEALEVAPDALAAAVAALRRPEVYGANVTIPHKVAVMPLLDELSEEARRIGAVNTIVNRDGRLMGCNTDAAGFLRALREDGGFEPAGVSAVVLGAGGAARAVAYALLQAGVSRLALYNRTPSAAQALAAWLERGAKVEVLEPSALPEAVRASQLLVNATSVGMAQPGEASARSPLEPGLLPREGFVCDLVYRPAQTRLLREAAAAGLRVQNGVPMLVYQGAEAFRHWTGQAAPVQVMRAALAL